jgi:multidrug resistance efflux pump
MSAISRLRRLLLGVGVLAVAGLAGWYLRSSLETHAAVEANGASVAMAPDPNAKPAAITALGRVAPKDGVLRLAGPSQSSVVISKLLVDKGDHVEAGQVVAVLDNYAAASADLARVRAELDHARSEFDRLDQLYRDKVVSLSERDNWRMRVNMLDAERQHAEVELDLANVRAPIAGQVLEVHSRAGEKVGPDGILELAKTDQMYVIAEVYETDIDWVRVGQRATISSRALPQAVQGTVERIGLKVGKADVLGVDPVAQTDARVVEVEIRLDDSQGVGGLTNAQVEVAIAP